MHRFFVFTALLFLCSRSFGQTVEIAPESESGKALQSLIVEARLDELRWPDFVDYRKHLRNFYGANGYALVWTRDGKLTPQAHTVIALFEAADGKGIHAVDYDGPRWHDRIVAFEAHSDGLAAARFDLALSASLMRYISDLHIGRINPRNLRFDLDIESKKYYLPKLLSDIAVAPDPGTILNPIEPQYDEYRRLQTALARYRKAAAQASAERRLPIVKALQQGDAYPALAQLARMLERTGDLAEDARVPARKYEEPLVGAVKHFQTRHALPPNGTIGAKTFAALNVPLSDRVRQIEWALERWRWAPAEFSAPPIVVNIPEFALRAWDEQGHTAVTMPVVVGQAYTHQTPVFQDEMKYVIFRPYWNVTPNIQRSELVPKVTKDRSYLASNSYEIVDDNGQLLGSSVDDAMLARLSTGSVRVRQKPGPSNALGLIKFIFPNENNVYFHSTPAQDLFGRSRRDFSHGCIRLEDPIALAAWVLRDQPQWTPETIRAAMEKGETRQVNLLKPVPILIIYTTAVALENGEVRFFEDIYGHDAALENALAAGYPYPA
ncbi:MAG: L,D-transpeptidase family protein [Acidobacteriota bacterium]